MSQIVELVFESKKIKSVICGNYFADS